jgi:hypothetical protein
VHLISHGSEGAIQLGGEILDFDSLLNNAMRIKSWGEALTQDADVLIYGCDVGAQGQGRALLDALARLTGADVAASDDVTGFAARGGDWDLEASTGGIETRLVLSAQFQAAYAYTWALIAQDSFDTSGALVGSIGGSGWYGAWSGDAMNLAGPSLSDPTGTLETSGYAAKHTGGALLETERDMATAAGTPGSTLWMSFLVQPDNTGPLSYAGVVLGSPGSAIFAGYQGNEFILGTANSIFGIVDTAAPVVSGETAFLVVRLDFAAGNDTATLYVNPTPGSLTPDSPAGGIAVKSDVNLGSFTRVALAKGQGFTSNDPSLDELRIGTSYQDVAPASLAPTATGLNVAHVYREDEALDLSDIVVSDADSSTVTVTLTLSDAAAGTLTTSTHGAAASTFSAGTWTVTGSVNDVNELLEDVSFVPTADYNGSFTVEVSITDGLSAPLTETLNFAGISVNDAPVLTLSGNQSSVSDGALRTVAGFASAVPGGGSDELSQAVSLWVTDVDNSALFTTQPHVDGAGTLRYQAVAGAVGTATVTVRARDTGGSAMSGQDTTERTFTIALSAPPVANNTPAGIALSHTTLDEGIDTTGTYAVGTLTALDADTGDTHAFVVVGGADAALFSIAGNQLRIADGVLDYESKSSYDVVIRATDSGTPAASIDQAFTITVSDLDAAPGGAVTVTGTATSESSGSAAMLAGDMASENGAATGDAQVSAGVQADEAAASGQGQDAALGLTTWASAPTAAAGEDEYRIVADLAEYPATRARAGAWLTMAPARAVLLHTDGESASDQTAVMAGATGSAVQTGQFDLTASADGGLRNAAWMRQLDDVRRNLQQGAGGESQVALANVMLGGGLSVGYVLWLLRGGLLLSTLVSTLPAWAVIDPLPVLSRRDRRDEDDQGDDALERLFARARAALARRPMTGRTSVPTKVRNPSMLERNR